MSSDNKQDVEIGEMRTNICWLKREITEIRKQVFNDLPHQIQSIKDRLFFGFIIGIAAVIITQIILKLYI